MAIVRISEFRAKASKAAELQNFLRSVVADIEQAQGSIECELLVERDDDSRAVLIEKWETAESHRAGAASIPHEKIEAIKDLLVEPPGSRYYDPVEGPPAIGRQVIFVPAGPTAVQ